MLDTNETSYSAERFIFKIASIVSEWPHELKDETICDGLEYRISIKPNDEEEINYIFKNKFPDDIYRLKMLIEEVLGEVKNV